MSLRLSHGLELRDTLVCLGETAIGRGRGRLALFWSVEGKSHRELRFPFGFVPPTSERDIALLLDGQCSGRHCQGV